MKKKKKTIFGPNLVPLAVFLSEQEILTKINVKYF